MRGSKQGDDRAFHVLSAFLTDEQIVLGEIACDEKSNEITAIPELLDIINVEKSIITIDAMGTQTKIAEKIIEKKPIIVWRSKGINRVFTTMSGYILKLKRLKTKHKRLKRGMAESNGVNIFLKHKLIGFMVMSVGRACVQSEQ